MTGGSPAGVRIPRREVIVTAAADLFARSGYAAVGMDDIGAAAGVTGPAIYRHFDGKAAVLAAVFDRIIDAVDLAGTSSRSTRRPGRRGGRPIAPADRLRTPRGVADRRRLMAVFVTQVHHLPPEHAVRLRERQRALVRRWRDLVGLVHPDWPSEQVRTSVHAVFGTAEFGRHVRLATVRRRAGRPARRVGGGRARAGRLTHS